MSEQYWNYIVTFVGLIGFYLSGKKIWWCWYVNIFNQILWFTYGWVTHQWGFVVGTFFYLFVFTRNAYLWTKEHRETVRYEKWRKENPDKFLSIGFKLDKAQIEAGMGKAAKAMHQISYSLQDAALTNRMYGMRLRPNRRTRWFGWIIRWHSPRTHYRHYCSCYRLKKPAVIGKVKSMEERDGGLYLTGEIDRTTPEGEAAWEAIKGPLDQVSIPEKGYGEILKRTLLSDPPPGPPWTHTFGGSVHAVDDPDEKEEDASEPELRSDPDPKREGSSE